MQKIFLIIFLLFPSVSHAEYWICHDEGVITRNVIGDCLSLGICSGLNNTGIDEKCFEAKEWEANEAREANIKVDINQPVGARIVKLSQEEIDANKAKQAQDEATAKEAVVASFDTKLDGVKLNDLTLTKVDAKIDAISSLAEAKAFLKLLVRGIIKLEAGQ